MLHTVGFGECSAIGFVAGEGVGPYVPGVRTLQGAVSSCQSFEVAREGRAIETL